MTEKPVDPDQCEAMHEVRGGVDALDAQIVDLLARRFAYMRAAARIKRERDAVRDEMRKAQVIENAKERATEAGIPEHIVTEIWELLVERSIAYELEEWDRRRD